MPQEYDNNMRGVLFISENKKSDKYPDFNGTITINNKEYKLAGWKKVGKSGKRFLSLAVRSPDDGVYETKKDKYYKMPDVADEDAPF